MDVVDVVVVVVAAVVVVLVVVVVVAAVVSLTHCPGLATEQVTGLQVTQPR